MYRRLAEGAHWTGMKMIEKHIGERDDGKKSRASTQALRLNTPKFTSYKAHHYNKSRNSVAMGMLLAVSLVLVCVLVLVRTWWPGAGVLTLRNDAAVPYSYREW